VTAILLAFFAVSASFLAPFGLLLAQFFQFAGFGFEGPAPLLFEQLLLLGGEVPSPVGRSPTSRALLP
jgi:hypothetical protein